MWVLVLLSGVSPLASDMYISALPTISRELHATPAAIQLSLTLFLIGMAVGQLIFGPLSDALGRRVFVIAGPAMFAALSVVCALSHGPALLIAARFIQGLAGASGLVAARAVVSDHFGHDGAARRFALIGSVTSIGPVFAPFLGGLILTATSWRMIFVLLAVIGTIMALGAFRSIPETLIPANKGNAGFIHTAHRFGSLLRDTRFMGFVATGCLVAGGLFTYVAGSPFVLQNVYDMTPLQFTLLFGTNSLGLALSGILFSRLVGRVRITRLLLAGLTITASAGLLLAISTAFVRPPLAFVWSALGLMVIGMGLINPGIVTLSQRAGAPLSGTAAAIQGGVQILFGALVTPLTGLIGQNSLTPMAILIGAFMTSALCLNRILARIQRIRLAQLD